MRSKSVIVLGLTSIFVLSVYACRRKPQVLSPNLTNLSKYSATLRTNIRKASASEYLPVRTPWKNPTIFIQLETISIISQTALHEGRRVFLISQKIWRHCRSPLGRWEG